MPTISQRGIDMPASPIRKLVPLANRAKAKGTVVYHLNIGQPDLATPEVALRAAHHLDREVLEYSPSEGILSFRKKLVEYYHKFNIDVCTDDIIITTGGSEAVFFSFMACLDPGDEIIVPEPAYANYMAFAISSGAVIKTISSTIDEGFALPSVEKFEALITPRTKAILICNPNNPTGALYPKEVLEGIVEIARQHHLIIFSDEIYDRLVMDGGEHISIASLAPDLFCVTFSGLSKSHMIAGFRIGWMILSGNKAIAQDYIEGIRMLSNMRLCSNVPAQSIVQTALGGYQSVSNYLTPGGRIYEQRECIYQALKDIPGLSVVKPKAAFYMFPKLDVKKFHITNDEQFALDLLRDKKILLIHGGGFHWEQPDHFRVVYLPRIEVLKESADKIADFLSYYQQNRR